MCCVVFLLSSSVPNPTGAGEKSMMNHREKHALICALASPLFCLPVQLPLMQPFKEDLEQAAPLSRRRPNSRGRCPGSRLSSRWGRWAETLLSPTPSYSCLLCLQQNHFLLLRSLTTHHRCAFCVQRCAHSAFPLCCCCCSSGASLLRRGEWRLQVFFFLIVCEY